MRAGHCSVEEPRALDTALTLGIVKGAFVADLGLCSRPYMGVAGHAAALAALTELADGTACESPADDKVRFVSRTHLSL